MGSIKFIEIETVFDLHEEGIQRFGGSRGVRDRGMIESALGAAQNALYYGNADVFEIAATYAYHLAQAQAFLDGNKRVAVAVALVFLAGNGHQEKPDGDKLYEAMIAIAERRLDKAGLAVVLRRLFG
ncbi:MAG: type II toxin-antitoxin system death-on-curing family toxin [Chthoniobacterales bacterium]